MKIRHMFRLLAPLLCLLLALPQGAAALSEAWIDRQVIRWGESFTLSWRLDPSYSYLEIQETTGPDTATLRDVTEAAPREVAFSLNAFEDNGRSDQSSFRITDAPLEGSRVITPPFGGYFYLWGGVGADGPFAFQVRVEGGPDEGDFRAFVQLDRDRAQPGDSLTASVSLVEGRQPYGPATITWRVRDAGGVLREVRQESGLQSTLTLPEGIQGEVEVRATDAAGRSSVARRCFGIGPEEPLRIDARLDQAALPARRPITASYAITGGQPPYAPQVDWSLTAAVDGMSMYGEREDGQGFSRFSPEEPGYGAATLTVRDAAGREVSSDTLRFIATDEQGRQVYPRLTEGLLPPPAVSTRTPATLNQRMATRSGPGTKYTEELGTLPQETEIVLIESVTTNGTPWGMVEFSSRGRLYRAYTGMKRIDAQGPVAQGSEEYTEVRLSQATPVYYGPGTEYAQRKGTVPAGTRLRLFDSENGFSLCDYQAEGKWIRAWFPVI